MGKSLTEKTVDEEHSDEETMSFTMTSSYDSINYSMEYGKSFGKSKSFYNVADENAPLLGSKRLAHPNETRSRLTSYTASILNATHSISKLTTSNYFGFSGAAYATAHERHMEVSKTVSLADIISLDRYTPTVVSTFTTLTMITGLSIFVFPLLVSHCGLYIIPLLITIATISCYTSHLIHKCQYQTSKNGFRKRVYENYIDLGKMCIKWHGEGLMKLLVASSVLTDVYSLVFCARISTDLLSQYINFDRQVWMIIWIGLVFPLFSIRKMSFLAWFGFIAIILYVAGLCFVFALLIWHYDLWSWQNINPKFDVKYFFVGYGIIMNTYNLQLAVPAIEASMKKPQDFPAMNITTFASNTVLKIFLAITGAAAFGVNTQSSLLTNLIPFGVYASVINALIGLYMYTQYPTSMFVVFEMLDLYVLPKFLLFKKGEKSEWGWIVLSRLLLSVFIAFVAICLPNFELLTGFIGNIRGTLTSIILPVYFYMTIHKRRLSKCSIVFHWMLIAISSLFAITGATFSVIGMFS
ncbi:proton-coupled amino acid transporter 1-like [Hydractinia symbiolongicarpus]|uniref:proton-coupled amino acid transporter 1-like n=1 Tax=Hydractinia symbiolongicarpus TaxID=13093 RepID=UPI00254A2465|nr:proton-coupled amino acid transporter 1-like [Hydractinia symbiolongicarpus]